MKPPTLSPPNNRILVIDDNPSIHEDFRKILSPGDAQLADELDADEAALFGDAPSISRQCSFEIDSAMQGQEGLKMVEAALAAGRPYAIAFVDIRMPPGWDGVETIQHLWASYPELQVVICTAYSDYSWNEITAQLGATDKLLILKKPFDNVEVLQFAHALTEKWALSHRLNGRLQDLDRMVDERTRDLVTANTKLETEAAEREHAQAELRRSEERFAKAFRASPVPIAIQRLDDQRYLDVNDSFLTLTGYRREELITGAPPAIQLWSPAARRDELLALLGPHGPVRAFEGQFLSKHGEPRDVVVSADVFDVGDDRCTLLLAEDITARLALEKQLRRSQKLEAVGQLAAGVAHDFNNLLTVIQGHATLQLAAKNLDSHLADSLNEVALAADRAAALTRQLLAFGRKQLLQPRLIDLNYVIRRLTKMLSRLIGETIVLGSDLAEHLPALCADEGNIEQILVNLVINARDAMPGGGTISIATAVTEVDAARAAVNSEARTGTFIRLTVTDSGSGMAPETLSHLFEPFFTTKEVGKGTGLGLATVYGIVLQQEGWIEVASALGAGTTFRIYLPAIEGQVAQNPETEAAPPSISGDETILVVEDEDAVRSIVQVILEDYGYHVLEAAHATEALAVWAQHRDTVQLLLTDVIMPGGITGCELAARLRVDDPKLKIVMTSGYSRDVVNRDLFDAQGIHYVSKPYRAHEIVRAVRQCLDTA